MPGASVTGATAGDRLRRGLVAALEAGPVRLLAVLAASAVLTGVAAVALLVAGQGPGPRPRENTVALVAACALAAAGVVSGAALLLARRRTAVPTGRDEAWSAVVLALAALLPALLLPVHYLAARTHPQHVAWLSFGFLDKRWLVSLVAILTLGGAVLLVLAARLVGTAREHPASWRAWLARLVPAHATAGAGATAARRRGAVALKVLGAVVVGWYFFGAPWHTAPTQLGYHETQTMGGVQGILAGSTPYLDAAAIQYGPGAEVANYLFMKLTGQVSVDGLREASLLFTWVAATLFLGGVYLRAGAPVAVVATVAAFAVFPTLQMFFINAAGEYDGFWGWTNPLRYVALWLIALALPVLIRRAESGRGRAGAVALGAGWALAALVSQENLLGGVLVAGILCVLLVATETAGARAVVRTVAGVVVGFALVALPVLAYYASIGRLGRFLELYWLLPQAVAAGYSNTAWHGEGGTMYRILPVLLAMFLLAAVVATRPLRVATRWCDRRVLVVSALVAALVCHLGALTRADTAHLKNTELALPGAVVIAAFYLPGLLGLRSAATRVLAGATIALSVVALLPPAVLTNLPRQVAVRLWRPIAARVDPPAPAAEPPGVPRNSIAVARIGPATIRQRRCCQKAPVTMPAFVRFLDRLHAVVGNRTAYVSDRLGLSAPSIPFLADLRPAPVPEEYGTMVINSRIRADWLRAFRRLAPRIDAMIVRSPRRRLARLWLAVHPSHRTVRLRYARRRFAYVLLGR